VVRVVDAGGGPDMAAAAPSRVAVGGI
jgi:hypothetical protein